MRLTCPNCAAQYEVPEDVIPDEGRDVQCSNCGQTWFQAAAGAVAARTAGQDAPDTGANGEALSQAAEEHPEPDMPRDVPSESPDQSTGEIPDAAPAPVPEPQDPAEPAAGAPETRLEDDPDGQPGADETEAADEEPAAAPAPQRTRALDPALSDILREEAEREASLRAAEGHSLETQPDLGLEEATTPEDEAARRSRQARDRMARIRGEDPRQLAAAETGSRKELLPDIEEINSTLRSAGSAAPAPQAASEEPPVRRKSSFARGFSLSVIAALMLVMVYDNAPLISEKLPQADPALSSYVGWVDQMRLWLDDQVRSLTSTQ
ncbi:zinc-ribbon domain-containing protein [Leisingera sp. HS039]|uniref:zinc-ribbon domain-containing protein n=1 Tax=Leisingera sp. HS039 TaxID=2818496 RepID=UPI001B3A4FCE|nr:zinc-ribbon domain-containing protein [Leisingera sp. HS039]MBQ4823482.1 zinc-ribbon domain-containing protein [Leisingera sp. HS039]